MDAVPPAPRRPLVRSSSHLVCAAILLVALASTTLAAPANTTSSQQDVASDGSGSSPYRRSAPFLLFALESLILGLALLAYGKRGWRFTCGVGLGLALELITWVAIVNSLDSNGFVSSSPASNDILIWAIVSIAGLVGLALGSFLWMLGMAAMSAVGGVAFSFTIVMMANNDLPPVPRHYHAICLAVAPLLQKTAGMAVVTSLAGSFLFFLGIDLLVNQTGGMSLGLRHLLDHNPNHAAALEHYVPPVSTRVFLALSWVFATVASVFQTLLYRQPFVRTYDSLLNWDIPDRQELEEGGRRDRRSLSKQRPMMEATDSHDTIASRIHRRYRQQTLDDPASPDSPNSRFALLKGAHFGHGQELSSPDTPPSRPSSIVSTSFADGLRSRPPTFFNEPLTHDAAPPMPGTSQPTDVSFTVPILAVGGAALSPPPAAVIKEDEASLRGHRSNSSSSSSEASAAGSAVSRRSWRKPVPYLDPADDPSGPAIALSDGGATSSFGGRHAAIERGLENGFLSGRDATIAPSASTPSSGDISTILGANFGLPREEPTPLPVAAPTDPSSSPEINLGTQLANARSPEVEVATMHDSYAVSAGRAPTSVMDESQVGGSEAEYERKTPDLVRGETPSQVTETSLASLTPASSSRGGGFKKLFTRGGTS
ncbi:hypothetical protein MNV49_002035 [Pseudohyphozyma bogoriensis]|nr:hypothetical protein MNV49_002035 [Pseudohyphozyma bogoriensis]